MMKLSRRRFLHLTAIAAGLPVNPRIAAAQAYPSRSVRMIVPFAPGGQVDVIGRLIAQKMTERFDKQFYVENVTGAGGNIGMGRAAQSVADGYTILAVEATSFVGNPVLYGKVAYDVYNDFDPITIAAGTTQLLTVNPSVPARTLGELAELIKASPGKYSFSSPGVGTGGHLIGELFRMSLGLDLVHVPFSGAGPAVGATVAGHTPITFGAPAAAVGHVKDGKLRAIAVASRKRLQALPDVPTTGEGGYPHIEANQWVGLLAPAGTARDIILSLNREMVRSMAHPEVKERLAALGFEPIGCAPEEMSKLIKVEAEFWAKIIHAAKVKAQ